MQNIEMIMDLSAWRKLHKVYIIPDISSCENRSDLFPVTKLSGSRSFISLIEVPINRIIHYPELFQSNSSDLWKSMTLIDFVEFIMFCSFGPMTLTEL